MAPVEVSYPAVLLGVVASLALGWAWYARPLFGRAWMAAGGKTEADVKAVPIGRTVALTLLCSFLQAWVLAQVLARLGSGTAPLGALVGVCVWLGFSGTSLATEYLYAARPLKLFVINVGFRLVDLAIVGAILGAFQ